jgi:hypothetical protein
VAVSNVGVEETGQVAVDEFSYAQRASPGSNKSRKNQGLTLKVYAAPAAIQATLSADGSSIGVSWTSTGADSYDIWRSFNGSGFSKIGSSLTTQFSDLDGQIAIGGIVTYVYRVVAVAGGTPSPASNSDIATRILFTDDPVVAAVTPIRGVHVDQARQAVDAVRVSAGLPRIWAAAPSVAGSTIFAWQFADLAPTSPPRDLLTALNQARQVLGLPLVSFAGLPAPAPGVAILQQHLKNLRDGVK